MWCPCWKSVSVSLLKVENVLKPPQYPTVKNNLAVGERICFWSANPITKPITKQATTLTTKVPKGKCRWCKLSTHLPSPNLVSPPSPLPINTAINSFIVCYQLSFQIYLSDCYVPKVFNGISYLNIKQNVHLSQLYTRYICN